jgi:hypothetical protein
MEIRIANPAEYIQSLRHRHRREFGIESAHLISLLNSLKIDVGPAPGDSFSDRRIPLRHFIFLLGSSEMRARVSAIRLKTDNLSPADLRLHWEIGSTNETGPFFNVKLRRR